MRNLSCTVRWLQYELRFLFDLKTYFGPVSAGSHIRKFYLISLNLTPSLVRFENVILPNEYHFC